MRDLSLSFRRRDGDSKSIRVELLAPVQMAKIGVFFYYCGGPHSVSHILNRSDVPLHHHAHIFIFIRRESSLHL